MTEGQLLFKIVQRFQSGLVFKAHRLLYHSSLGLRVIKKKREVGAWRRRAVDRLVRGIHNKGIENLIGLLIKWNTLSQMEYLEAAAEAGFLGGELFLSQ